MGGRKMLAESGQLRERRFRLPLTMAAVTLLDGKIAAVERIDLETAEYGKP